jgi:serine/threonine protein kinase
MRVIVPHFAQAPSLDRDFRRISQEDTASNEETASSERTELTRLGDLLAGRYVLRRALGRGGTSRVYEAWDTTLSRGVAVKLFDDQVADPALVDWFTRETEALVRLAHPNIVIVHDAGHDGGVRYLVMELVRGGSLAELLWDGPLPPGRAATIAADVCLALEHAHRQGVMHHGLKPANILLTPDDQVKVTDFGVARARAAALPGGSGVDATLGSAEYLAPEQVTGGAVDARTDVYALGCCLYEMLIGQPPFGRVGEPDGDDVLTAMIIARRQQHEPPEPVAHHRVDVPTGLDRAVLKALAKQPDERQQTAEKLHRDLGRFSRRSSGASIVAGAPPGLLTEGAEGEADLGLLQVDNWVAEAAEGAAQRSSVVAAPAKTATSASVDSDDMEASGHATPSPPVLAAPSQVIERAKTPVIATTNPVRRPATSRRYVWLASLALLAVIAGGTLMAFSPSNPNHDAALNPPAGPEVPLGPTTLPTFTTAAASTTTSTTRPTTTAPPSTASSSMASSSPALSTTAPRAAAPATTNPATTASRSSQAPSVAVPELIGREVDEASAELEQRGLTHRVEKVSTRRPSKLHRVVDQDPEAGTRVPRGTTVTLVVATEINLLDISP